MRTPALIRIVILAAAVQLTAACSSTGYSGFNPFDGDPGGPPPAPKLWDGAYAGDQASYASHSAPRAQDAGRLTRAESAPAERIVRAPVRKAGDDYGTNRIDAAELPPPDYRDEHRESTRVAERSYPQDRGRADRTLTTTRAAETAPANLTSHKVRSGEDLSDIADAYGVREVDIIKQNGLKPPYSLRAGQALQIPGRAKAEAPGEGEYVKAGDAAVPQPKPMAKPAAVAPVKAAEAPASKPAEKASSDGSQFDWPISGKVVSNFGEGGDGLYNEGINIAAPAGTPVRAAASGTVRYAGNELRGYGNLVLIEHTGGYVTAYAHNQVLTVKRGDKIARGDVIARVGQTGNVKSPQLHFEVRKGTKSIDPSKMLVARR